MNVPEGIFSPISQNIYCLSEWPQNPQETSSENFSFVILTLKKGSDLQDKVMQTSFKKSGVVDDLLED